MIAEADIAAWRQVVPWLDPDQVEQDLVLSRMIIEIALHPLLGGELVFRGGTCFHKLWLDRPWRYSEDLDYVRRTEGGVGEIFDAIREVGTAIGFDDVKTAVGVHPKVRLRSRYASGNRLQIKIEMNTHERAPTAALVKRHYAVESPWFSHSAMVPTFAVEELIATKIRALYQRTKGRDLFDLWLAVVEVGIAPEQIAAMFGPYRPAGWTPNRARQNLAAKLEDDDFIHDLEQLVLDWPAEYSIEAGAAIAASVISAIESRN